MHELPWRQTDINTTSGSKLDATEYSRNLKHQPGNRSHQFMVYMETGAGRQNGRARIEPHGPISATSQAALSPKAPPTWNSLQLTSGSRRRSIGGLLQNDRKNKVWEIESAVVGARGGYILRGYLPSIPKASPSIPRRLVIPFLFPFIVIIYCRFRWFGAPNFPERNLQRQDQQRLFFFCPNSSSALLVRAIAYFILAALVAVSPPKPSTRPCLCASPI